MSGAYGKFFKNPFCNNNVQEVMDQFLKSKNKETSCDIIECLSPVMEQWIFDIAENLKLNAWTCCNS